MNDTARGKRGADLAADTAVRRVAKVPGLYAATLPNHWNYIHPSGGALTTVALRAMTDALARPDLVILSSTTVFATLVPPGDLAVRVDVVRNGETAAQVRASLSHAARPGPGLEVLATFVRPIAGPDVTGVSMPNVPPPDRCVRMGGHRKGSDDDFRVRGAPFFANVETAQALGAPMWEPGGVAGDAHVAFWHRYVEPQRDANGALDPLAIPPLADTMPPSLVQKLGPDAADFIAPSLDLTVYFLGRAMTEWILVESFSERAVSGYAVASANLWDERGALVARAAQSMTIRSTPR